MAISAESQMKRIGVSMNLPENDLEIADRPVAIQES
jgi:hypothetical protein